MYTMVGKILDSSNLVGFRLINLDTYEYIDVKISKVKETIRSITNLKIGSNGTVIGGSGKLENYGNYDDIQTTSSKYTLLNSIIKDDRVIGYRVSSSNGEIRDIMKEKLILLNTKGRLTNCRKNREGVSLIKGSMMSIDYDKRVLKRN